MTEEEYINYYEENGRCIDATFGGSSKQLNSRQLQTRYKKFLSRVESKPKPRKPLPKSTKPLPKPKTDEAN